MSTIKTPQQKKELSLERDRRNTYGENAKASRNSIPKSKQRSRQSERRSAKVPLQAVRGAVTEEIAENSGIESRLDAIEKRRRAFKKRPDQPLGLVLDVKSKSNKNSLKAYGDLVDRKRRGLL